MISVSRHLIKNIVKRPYWTPSINTKNIPNNFIDYDKYVQDTAEAREQITEIKKGGTEKTKKIEKNIAKNGKK